MGKNENIEITRILDILKSKKLVILFILIIFTLLGYLYSYHYVVPKYKSTSTLLLIPNSTAEGKVIMTSDLAVNTDLTVNSGLIETYRSIGENSKVLKQVINNLGLDMTEEELLKEMKISVMKDTYVIQVSVTNEDPQKAMDIAKEFDEVFLQEIKEIYHLNNIGIVDEARLPEKPYNINHLKDMIMFLVAGMGVSFLTMIVFYLFDNTIKKEEEIEKYIQLKSLGSIPMNQDKAQEIVDRSKAKSYVTECINTIRTNILYMNSANSAKTILITSCTPREGKSWVSANIATAFAETDKKVLLVDADMRKGRAHKIFKVDNTEGLSNYLYAMTGEKEEDINMAKNYIKETQIPNLHILTNGIIPPNPSELLESSAMKELLEILKNIYDVVIIDAPPCKLVTDSIILSTIVDSTILVANAEKTKMNDFNEVKKSIQMVDGEIIGAILNKKRIAGKVYSKGYYYGHDETQEIEEVKPREIISVENMIQTTVFDFKENDVEVKEETKQAEQTSSNMVQKDYEDIKQFMNEKLKELQKDYNQLADNVKDTTYMELLIKRVEQEKLTAEEIKTITSEIIKNHTEELINTMKNEKSNEEQIQKLLQQELNVMKNDKNNNEQQIQELLNEKITNMQKETQELMKQEITKMDYTKQINQINEMLTNLKDSYLELSNKMKTNDEEMMKYQETNKNNRNIIDFRAFKKQKNKKKVYSIEEDIAYEDLEEVATYIIPLQTRKISGDISCSNL